MAHPEGRIQMKFVFFLMSITILAAMAGVFSSFATHQKDIQGDKKTMAKTENHLKKATFAGGCFWCVESDFEKVDGVIEVISGYTGGHKENPAYEEVSAGVTGHAEAVQVLYDPEKVSYDALLDVFWRHVDPTGCGRPIRGSGFPIPTRRLLS